MKLKNCPFCGGEAKYERVGTGRVSCIVVCCDCGCRLESNETWGSGEDWNKRTKNKVSAKKITDKLFEEMWLIEGACEAFEKEGAAKQIERLGRNIVKLYEEGE